MRGRRRILSTVSNMTYTKRTLWLHAALFLLAFLAFILPVVFGASALLPVWLTGGLSLGIAACVLVDAAYKFFAPSSPRSLRLLSGLAGLVLLIGWGIWVYIYGNMAAVGTGAYRIGTFLLGAGSVLNLFVVAISLLDVQRKVK